MQHPSFSHVLGTPLLVHEENRLHHIFTVYALSLGDLYVLTSPRQLVNTFYYPPIIVFIHLLTPV